MKSHTQKTESLWMTWTPYDYAYAFAQKPMIQIVSSRGCPNQCNFCSYPSTMGGRIYRTRSVKDLADEFEYILKEIPQIKEIFIEDDTFTVDQNRVIDFCDEIIKRGLKPAIQESTLNSKQCRR